MLICRWLWHLGCGTEKTAKKMLTCGILRKDSYISIDLEFPTWSGDTGSRDAGRAKPESNEPIVVKQWISIVRGRGGFYGSDIY